MGWVYLRKANVMNYGKKAIAILAIMAMAWWLTGCTYMNKEVPHASAAISDDVTSASLQLGAVGEFTFIVTHCRTLDGPTTGTVAITHTKTTENNFLVGVLSAIGGFIAGAGM